jgi:hypothetical protein
MDAERAQYLARFERAMAESPCWTGADVDRGIVTAGSLKFAPYLWILIRSLRHAGCTLPIELWHMAGEMNRPVRDWFEPYGVTFRDAGQLPWGRHRFFNGSHGFKPYAVMHSRFREVLFLDADNCAVRDPSFLFDAPEYRETGAVFWSDPVAMTGRLGGRELRADYGLEPGGEEFESGQFIVDRQRCWRALALTLHVNELSGYYYRFLFGDKETFRLAFDAVRQPYRLVGQPPDARQHDWRKVGHLQYWTDGQPLFQHRVGRKWEMRVTDRRNHHLPHLPDVLFEDIFDTLGAAWPNVMPLDERLRPYGGIIRRTVQPEWTRPYFGWLRTIVRTFTERERR